MPGLAKTSASAPLPTRKRRLLDLSLVAPVIFTFLCPVEVHALSCDGPFSVDFYHEAAQWVLVGTFQQVWEDDGEVVAEVSVDELFKGEADKTLILSKKTSSMIAGAGGSHLLEGEKWLLFLHDGGDSAKVGQARWPQPCGGSKRLDGERGTVREYAEAWLAELRAYADGGVFALREPWRFHEGRGHQCSMGLRGVHESSPEDPETGYFMEVGFFSSDVNPFSLSVAYRPRGLRYTGRADGAQPVVLIIDGEVIQLDPPRDELARPRFWRLQDSEAEFVLDRMGNLRPDSVEVSLGGDFVEKVSLYRFSSAFEAFQKCRNQEKSATAGWLRVQALESGKRRLVRDLHWSVSVPGREPASAGGEDLYNGWLEIEEGTYEVLAGCPGGEIRESVRVIRGESKTLTIDCP